MTMLDARIEKESKPIPPQENGTVPQAFFSRPISENVRHPKRPDYRKGSMTTELYHDLTVENFANAIVSGGAVIAAGIAIALLSRRLR